MYILYIVSSKLDCSIPFYTIVHDTETTEVIISIKAKETPLKFTNQYSAFNSGTTEYYIFTALW